MTDWPALLQIPEDLAAPGPVGGWFAVVADRLLNGCELVVARQAYRLIEVEFYLHNPNHLDPFPHRDSTTLHCGCWYFHRTHGVYRGGSFKGVDLTFGNGTSYGGILIRSLRKPDGSVIVGPSLCVDHLLDATGAESVAALDRAIVGRRAWQDDNPLSLRFAEFDTRRELLCTPRVGLSLRRTKAIGEATRYLMAPYRFLSEPRRIGKGKPHMVLALHVRGADIDTIQHLTGCPKASIRRYIKEFEIGREEGAFAPYFGVEIGPNDWCRLYGIWQRVYGMH